MERFPFGLTKSVWKLMIQGFVHPWECKSAKTTEAWSEKNSTGVSKREGSMWQSDTKFSYNCSENALGGLSDISS